MTMRVTMLNSRRGEGVDLIAGQTYTVSDALGAQLVGAGHATDTDKALTPPGSEPVRASTNPLTGGIELTAGGAPLQITAPITTPVGFRGTTLATALDLRRLGGQLVTNFDITSLIPAVTTKYFVDPINGNNANSGLTAPLAKKDLAVVLVIANCDQIEIVGLTADYVGLGVQSWNNVQPVRSLSVINNTGYRYISAVCASLPTWAVNGTYSNVFSTVIGSTGAAGAIDVSVSTTPTYTDLLGASVSASNVPKRYRTLVKVANLAAVAATAGTWFYDGTSLHVRSHDDRNLVGDTKMLPTGTAQGGRFPAAINSCTIYTKGIDFVGGQNAFYVGMASAITGCVFAHNNCSFQGAGVGQGLAVLSFSKIYGYRSASYDNYVDGFNYHSQESDGTTSGTSPEAVEIECVAAGNGTTGSGGASDNASTGHDYANVIRLNGAYINSSDRVVADTNFAHSWIIGCYVGQALTVSASQQSLCAIVSAKMWADSCYIPTGSNARLLAGQTATMRLFNSGTAANDVTGEATGTVSSYYG